MKLYIFILILCYTVVSTIDYNVAKAEQPTIFSEDQIIQMQLDMQHALDASPIQSWEEWEEIGCMEVNRSNSSEVNILCSEWEEANPIVECDTDSDCEEKNPHIKGY